MKVVSEKEAIEQIFRTVDRVEPGSAPFVLVLGSGFSHGLVPTVEEIVTESLPLWMHCQRSKECFEIAKKKPSADRSKIARAFWKRMADERAKRGPSLPLDLATGLPSNYADAYKAAFDPDYFEAVGEPAQARKFQRALMRLEDSRLNAAHFLLASMLGVQPGKTRPSQLFQARGRLSHRGRTRFLHRHAAQKRKWWGFFFCAGFRGVLPKGPGFGPRLCREKPQGSGCLCGSSRQSSRSAGLLARTLA